MTIADLFSTTRCICGRGIARSKAVIWEDSVGTRVHFHPDHASCLAEWNIVRTDEGYYHLHHSPPEDDAPTDAYPITERTG